MESKEIYQRLTQCGIPATLELAQAWPRITACSWTGTSRMDLTAVTEEAEMLDRHYVDALSPWPGPGFCRRRARSLTWAPGRAFRGLPLAMACPGLRVTLLDAQQKRLNFLEAVVRELGLTNVTLCHSRAEDGARNPALRERFDVAVARRWPPCRCWRNTCCPMCGWAAWPCAGRGLPCARSWRRERPRRFSWAAGWRNPCP